MLWNVQRSYPACKAQAGFLPSFSSIVHFTSSMLIFYTGTFWHLHSSIMIFLFTFLSFSVRPRPPRMEYCFSSSAQQRIEAWSNMLPHKSVYLGQNPCKNVAFLHKPLCLVDSSCLGVPPSAFSLSFVFRSTQFSISVRSFLMGLYCVWGWRSPDKDRNTCVRWVGAGRGC